MTPYTSADEPGKDMSMTIRIIIDATSTFSSPDEHEGLVKGLALLVHGECNEKWPGYAIESGGEGGQGKYNLLTRQVKLVAERYC